MIVLTEFYGDNLIGRKHETSINVESLTDFDLFTLHLN